MSCVQGFTSRQVLEGDAGERTEQAGKEDADVFREYWNLREEVPFGHGLVDAPIFLVETFKYSDLLVRQDLGITAYCLIIQRLPMIGR